MAKAKKNIEKRRIVIDVGTPDNSGSLGGGLGGDGVAGLESYRAPGNGENLEYGDFQNLYGSGGDGSKEDFGDGGAFSLGGGGWTGDGGGGGNDGGGYSAGN